MKIQKEDILAPANFITVAGLVLTLWGSFQLNTVNGFWLALVGRLFDNLDGIIARRTHTSRLGAVMDATADKFSGLFILLGAYHFRLVPMLFLMFLFTQHLLVSLLSLIAFSKGKVLEVTKIGKINMFLQIAALLAFTGSRVSQALTSQVLTVLAVCLAVGGAVTGIIATYSYLRDFQKLIRSI